jgi:hypothetical protein
LIVSPELLAIKPLPDLASATTAFMLLAAQNFFYRYERGSKLPYRIKATIQQLLKHGTLAVETCAG